MKTGILISGYGGQGVMLAGTLLCYAGISEGREVTFFPSYGAEMRGGTANCQVIISDSPIGSPVVSEPDILICLNAPSWDRFAVKTPEGGLIVANSSLVKNREKAAPGTAVYIPANNIAEECGSVLSANVVLLGAMSRLSGTVSIGSIKESIPPLMSGRKKGLAEINIRAAEAGYKAAAGAGDD